MPPREAPDAIDTSPVPNSVSGTRESADFTETVPLTPCWLAPLDKVTEPPTPPSDSPPAIRTAPPVDVPDTAAPPFRTTAPPLATPPAEIPPSRIIEPPVEVPDPSPASRRISPPPAADPEPLLISTSPPLEPDPALRDSLPPSAWLSVEVWSPACTVTAPPPSTADTPVCSMILPAAPLSTEPVAIEIAPDSSEEAVVEIVTAASSAPTPDAFRDTSAPSMFKEPLLVEPVPALIDTDPP